MQITAAMVKNLRERTGAGMMECKKALNECNGDMEAAIDLMRKSGQAKADKKAGRTAAEGAIVITSSDDGREVAMVEINCETDFVAKDENFLAFSRLIAQQILTQSPTDIMALNKIVPTGESESIEQIRLGLISKIGENMQVRRFERINAAGDEIGTYLHGRRIGVLVDIKGGNEALAKDIAMHIAASRPLCVAEKDVPADVLKKEREIFTAQAQDSGKPPEIIDKMVAGRIRKYLSEITLLGQVFVKDQDMTIAELLGKQNAEILSFICYEVGEGIEKKTDNFAEEVMAQAKGA